MSFDVLAPHYRWMELLLAGDKLQRCRTAFLHETVVAKTILLLGEGNGRFLLAARRAIPEATITCVDASPRMLQLARRRLLRAGISDEQVKYIEADVLDWRPQKAQFDLVVTHFFLDCFRSSQIAAVVKQINVMAAPAAQWLLADFCEAPAGLARFRTKIILGAMYLFFRCATRLPARNLSCPDLMLEHAGFHLRRRQISEWGLLHSDLWQRTVC